MIAIDWGTSSLRAYLVEAGRVVASRSTGQGILHVNDEFKKVFDEITLDWDGAVYMSGMIGSSKGWLETPYCAAPFRLTDLGQYLIEATHLTNRSAWIVPGVKQEHPINMMRGEEVQALGALEFVESGCVVLCGTHSKHVQVDNGQLIRFETFMTGELYALLQQHSILAGSEDWIHDDFLWGVKDGSKQMNLLQQLFSVRAQTLNETLKYPRAYLSGLLIGTELYNASLVNNASSCTLIGSEHLMNLYRIALEGLYPKMDIHLFSAEKATLEGLKHIHRRHNEAI